MKTESKYLKIFKKIEADIEKHPLLELVKADYNSGLSKRALSKYQRQLSEFQSHLQHMDLENFFMLYQECNGFEISWKFLEAIDDNTFEELRTELDDYQVPESGRKNEVGRIKFLPFEEVFIQDMEYFDVSYSDEFDVEFNDIIYPGNTFGELLYPFDMFSEYSCMSFVFDEERQEPKVILLSDYYIVWNSSLVTYLDSYMNFLGATRGLIKCREEIFEEYRGELKEPVMFDFIPYGTKIEPKLFKLDGRYSGSHLGEVQ